MHEARDGVVGTSFIFKERLEEDARAWNTDAARVDKDLFKVGALLDAYALLPFILRATAWKSYNRMAAGVSEEKYALSGIARPRHSCMHPPVHICEGAYNAEIIAKLAIRAARHVEKVKHH